MNRVVVITSDSDIDKMTIPIPIEKITAVAADRGMSFDPTDERRMLEWCSNISCTDPECPITSERIEQLLNSHGDMRTLIWEDRALSSWVLSVWKVIERSRGV
ncbi:hypothetical protein UFOVP1244_121 [uncultured Caudovirales phage]|uniref:Uncharacterized protein n=1 Tax=uncultured Caudovirales phage TaxID=2100421 RepID=A0A6J5RGU3_9CAUD|nr:hypothetical protein UFOVP1244_121 [uncultured Caudovirales phage]